MREVNQHYLAGPHCPGGFPDGLMYHICSLHILDKGMCMLYTYFVLHILIMGRRGLYVRVHIDIYRVYTLK